MQQPLNPADPNVDKSLLLISLASFDSGAAPPSVTWEPTKHLGVFTFWDGKKRWYHCEACDYVKDRIYHTHMHFLRIHVKNGRAVPKKQKFSTAHSTIHMPPFLPFTVSREVNKQTTKPARHTRPEHKATPVARHDMQLLTNRKPAAAPSSSSATNLKPNGGAPQIETLLSRLQHNKGALPKIPDVFAMDATMPQSNASLGNDEDAEDPLLAFVPDEPFSHDTDQKHTLITKEEGRSPWITTTATTCASDQRKTMQKELNCFNAMIFTFGGDGGFTPNAPSSGTIIGQGVRFHTKDLFLRAPSSLPAHLLGTRKRG